MVVSSYFSLNASERLTDLLNKNITMFKPIYFFDPSCFFIFTHGTMHGNRRHGRTVLDRGRTMGSIWRYACTTRPVRLFIESIVFHMAQSTGPFYAETFPVQLVAQWQRHGHLQLFDGRHLPSKPIQSQLRSYGFSYTSPLLDLYCLEPFHETSAGSVTPPLQFMADRYQIAN